jgi:hypothetical protein
MEAQLEEIDAKLFRFSDQLSLVVKRTPLAQLRATLPFVAQSFPAEAAALLDLCISTTDFELEDPYLIDYLVTLLATDQVGGHRTLKCDPVTVSSGVTAQSQRHQQERGTDDPVAQRAARLLRDAAMEVSSASGIEPLVTRVRELKREIGLAFFDQDVLRSIVQYNMAVANRFELLSEQERSQDEAMQGTLSVHHSEEGPALGDATPSPLDEEEAMFPDIQNARVPSPLRPAKWNG